jgi:PAS domain-containing protein
MRWLFALISLLVLSGCEWSARSVSARQGVLDLRGVNLENQVLELGGEWLIVWGRDTLASPQPGSWVDLQQQGRSLPVVGQATYLLRILLDSSSHTQWVLSTKEINSASHISINGVALPDIGRGRLHHIFTPGSTELLLRIDVENELDIRPGIPCPVYLGGLKPMTARAGVFLLIQSALLGVFALLALLYFASWLLRHKEHASLLLALHSLSWGFYTLFQGVDASPAETLFPQMPVLWMQKGYLISTAFSFPMTCRLWLALFPHQWLRRALPVLEVCSITLVLLVLFAGPIHWQWYNAYLVIGNVYMLLLLFVVAQAVWFRKPGAWVFLLGLLVFLGVTAMGTIHFRGEWVGAGAFALVLADSLVLTRRRAQAFDTVELQKAELERAQSLRAELSSTILQKQMLEQRGARLESLLHSMEQPLLVLDEDNLVCFANQGGERLFQTDGSVVGRSWDELCASEKTVADDVVITHLRVPFHAPRLLAARRMELEIGGERLEALLFQAEARNEIGDHVESEAREKAQEPRALGVAVMKLGLSVWEACTGLGKADFAEVSGLWKVNADANGWRRTPTLDKYLEMGKMPQLPKWRKILDSVDFVVAAAQHRAFEGPLLNELKALREQLEQRILGH